MPCAFRNSTPKVVAAGGEDSIVEGIPIPRHGLQMHSCGMADLAGAAPSAEGSVLGGVLGSAHVPTSIWPDAGSRMIGIPGMSMVPPEHSDCTPRSENARLHFLPAVDQAGALKSDSR